MLVISPFHKVDPHEHINRLIEPLLAECRADRITVFRIEESKSSLLTYVLTTASIATRSGKIPGEPLNLPSTMYSAVLPKLLERQPVYLVTKGMSDAGLRNLLKEPSSEAALWTYIPDSSGSVIGINVVSWAKLSDVPTGKDYDQMLKLVRVTSDKIGKYLE